MVTPGMQCAAVELRPRRELGATRSAGLAGTHHFSFATYQRLDRIEWGGLRALHEYRLGPGARRSPTFHSGFEIVTLVIEGHIRRLGSFESGDPMRPGAIEVISSGPGAQLGVEAVGADPASYLEIWIKSAKPSAEPRRQWRPHYKSGLSEPVAAGARAPESGLRLDAEAEIFHGILRAGARIEPRLDRESCAYALVSSGKLAVGARTADSGDAVAASGPGLLSLEARQPSTLLLVITRKRD